MIKQNEIKVLLMAKAHGGNLHHIYADTEILSARSLIILSRIPDWRIPYCRFHCMHLIVVFLIKIAPKITAFNKICTHHQYFFLNKK
jgi:hypothetical protein